MVLSSAVEFAVSLAPKSQRSKAAGQPSAELTEAAKKRLQPLADRFTRLRGSCAVDLLVHADAAKALNSFVIVTQEYSSLLRLNGEFRQFVLLCCSKDVLPTLLSTPSKVARGHASSAVALLAAVCPSAIPLEVGPCLVDLLSCEEPPGTAALAAEALRLLIVPTWGNFAHWGPTPLWRVFEGKGGKQLLYRILRAWVDGAPAAAAHLQLLSSLVSNCRAAVNGLLDSPAAVARWAELLVHLASAGADATAIFGVLKALAASLEFSSCVCGTPHHQLLLLKAALSALSLQEQETAASLDAACSVWQALEALFGALVEPYPRDPDAVAEMQGLCAELMRRNAHALESLRAVKAESRRSKTYLLAAAATRAASSFLFLPPADPLRQYVHDALQSRPSKQSYITLLQDALQQFPWGSFRSDAGLHVHAWKCMLFLGSSRPPSSEEIYAYSGILMLQVLPRRLDNPGPLAQELAFWALSAWLSVHELKWSGPNPEKIADSPGSVGLLFRSVPANVWLQQFSERAPLSSLAATLLLACIPTRWAQDRALAKGCYAAAGVLTGSRSLPLPTVLAALKALAHWGGHCELRSRLSSNVRLEAALQELAAGRPLAPREPPSSDRAAPELPAAQTAASAPSTKQLFGEEPEREWTPREHAYLQSQVQAWAQHCLAEIYQLYGVASPLGKHMGQLLQSGGSSDADVVFLLEGGRVQVGLHEAVLAARCPMLASGVAQQRHKEAAPSGSTRKAGATEPSRAASASSAIEVRMGGKWSADSFRAAAEYIYTGQARLAAPEGAMDEAKKALVRLAKALQLHAFAACVAGARPHGMAMPLQPANLAGALRPAWLFTPRAGPPPEGGPGPDAAGSEGLLTFPRAAVVEDEPAGGFCLAPGADVLLAVVCGAPTHESGPAIRRDGMLRLSELAAVELTTHDEGGDRFAQCPREPAFVLIPAHRCILRARVEYFGVLFSERWEAAQRLPQEAGTGFLDRRLPIVTLPEGNLWAAGLLLNYVYSEGVLAHGILKTQSSLAREQLLPGLVNAAALAELLTLPEMEQQCVAAIEELLPTASLTSVIQLFHLAWERERWSIMELAGHIIASKPDALWPTDVESRDILQKYRLAASRKSNA